MMMWTLLLVAPFLWVNDAKPAQSESSKSPRLERAVKQLASHPSLKSLDVGVAVGCVGDTPVHHQGDKLLNPASGAKLLSTAAALREFGPDTRFELKLYGKREGDKVSNLTLVASGDPSLDTKILQTLAKKLAKSGVRYVTDGLIIDMSEFAGGSTPPAYEQKKTDAAYRPEVPPLGINSGAIGVTVRPGRAVGDRVRVSVSHEVPSIRIESSAQTIDGKRIDKLRIDAVENAKGETVIKVSGSLGAKASAQGVRKRVAHPELLAGDWFVRELRAAKIGVKGNVKVVEKANAQRGDLLTSVQGKPVSSSIAEINQVSNNFMAESLFRLVGKATGKPSWKGAQVATGKHLEQLGVPSRSFKVVNGSGLYDATQISAIGMVKLLSAMDVQRGINKWFRESLAKPGEKGTLSSRMSALKGKLFAKTGTLNSAVSLSGYLSAPQCTLAFSVIINGEIGDKSARVNRTIDEWITGLAN